MERGSTFKGSGAVTNIEAQDVKIQGLMQFLKYFSFISHLHYASAMKTLLHSTKLKKY